MKDSVQKKNTNFLWGVTNIGSQVEGGCTTSDWYAWACRDQVPAIGRANEYWRNFTDDHDLVTELGCTAYRMTIEWARIEPEEGKFDEDAIAHYREILLDLKRRNIKTVVGLWHYTLPTWFADHYGTHHKNAPALFGAYSEKVIAELGDLIDVLVILNEPMVYIGLGYIRGERPPFYRDVFKAWRALQNLISIQKSIYNSWKQKYPAVLSGSTHLCNEYRGDSFIERIAMGVSQYARYEYFLNRTKNHQDFVGVNYYTSEKMSFHPFQRGGTFGFHGHNDWGDPDVWKSFPAGLHRVLTSLHQEYYQPLIITENGKPTNSGVDDTDRQQFLTQSVTFMNKAMDDGADVQGYFHHSLTDCYEWTSGYNFTFGVVEVDREMSPIKKTKRNSFATYQKIIESQ